MTARQHFYRAHVFGRSPAMRPGIRMGMERIAIIGTTGAGKTTLARELAGRAGCHCCELDAINWQPNWTELEPAELVRRVGDIVDCDRWVVEGNYACVRPLIWQRADTLIWLDYSFPVIFGRLLKRTIRRNVTREDLWSGNRESLGRTLSRQSILLWCIKSYGMRRRQYSQGLADPAHGHLRVLRFRHPREVRIWLDSLEPRGARISAAVAPADVV